MRNRVMNGRPRPEKIMAYMINHAAQYALARVKLSKKDRLASYSTEWESLGLYGKHIILISNYN